MITIATAPTIEPPHIPEPAFPKTQYRQGIGVVIAKPNGQIFAGQRIDNPQPHWQCVQGGIDEHETAIEALWREILEETGIAKHHLDLISMMPSWVHYDLPPDLRGQLWKGRFIGQQQLWFLTRFHGTDHDIQIHHRSPEFRHYAWLSWSEILAGVVPFKRPLYHSVGSFFAPLLP